MCCSHTCTSVAYKLDVARIAGQPVLALIPPLLSGMPPHTPCPRGYIAAAA